MAKTNIKRNFRSKSRNYHVIRILKVNIIKI